MELKRLGEHLALTRATKQLQVKEPEVIGLAHKLVYEATRRRNFLDFIINSALAPRNINDFRLGLRAFLRLYTYETKVLNGDFEKAVSIAKLGRSILGWRELREVEEALGIIMSLSPKRLLEGLSDEKRVGLSTCHPTWFVKYCFRLFGRREALKLLESAIEAPPTYIRINTLKASEENLLKKLEAEGIILEKVKPLKYAYQVIRSQKPLTKTESFRKGLFYIQDKASCLAAEVADPHAGMTVLDVCSAPGAKTTYLAQLMENRGVIYSIDYSKRRTEIWRQETKRLGVKIAVPLIADACRSLPTKVLADLVVLDPPCTSTGAFGRTPSAKWRLTKRSILNMAKVQWEMLNRCAERVKEKGFLIYSTCSITLEENEMLIERFLKGHPEFHLVETAPKMGLPGLRGQNECQRLYPHIHKCNGFFIAKLVREF